MFETKLEKTVDIRAVYDFNAFLKGCRDRIDDRNIRKQFAFTFEVKDSKVFVRSKKTCAASTPWGPWAQMYPRPGADSDSVIAPDVCPDMAPHKPWPELKETIAPQLTKFYERQFVHPVSIPESDLREMRK